MKGSEFNENQVQKQSNKHASFSSVDKSSDGGAV
eukprot:g39377.t1